ncbi:MAG: hypothetical protein M3395_10830, partial [Chloroflexota bacterium]|nr:hypothetical protein [Chloroflexota bacterium]
MTRATVRSVEASEVPTRGSVPAQVGIQPARVRDIELGRAESWEAECLRDGIIRFGFDTADSQRFESCRAGPWADLKRLVEAQGEPKGSATRICNQARAFFQDDGSTLWLTFVGSG